MKPLLYHHGFGKETGQCQFMTPLASFKKLIFVWPRVLYLNCNLQVFLIESFMIQILIPNVIIKLDT